MRHWAALTVVVLVAVAALWLAEHRKAEAPVGPSALLSFIGDSERELSRLPMSATRLSDEEEIRIGNELMRQYDAGFRRKTEREDEAVQTYVSRVGGRVAAKAHRRLPYSFHYVPDDSFVNAFALPGGPVFIGAGLISLMDSEDELASVLGHEVEHIDHRHCAERVQLEARTRGMGIFRVLLQIPVAVFEVGYSKQQELQADSEGTRLMVQAGYSPGGSLRMFETYDRLYQEHVARARSPQEELSQVALDTLSGYFRSHPPSNERAQQIRQLIATEHWNVGPEIDLEIGYVFWTRKAKSALKAHKYEQAQSQAEQALRLRPEYMPALFILANAQERLGDFSAAAEAFRRMLAHRPDDTNLALEYANALAGVSNHAKAYHEFSDWLKSNPAPNADSVVVAQAGLALLAGDASLAKASADRAKKETTQAWAPDTLKQLGRWYYLARRYEQSIDCLTRARQLRPGDAAVGTYLGWSQIEVHHYGDALTSFAGVRSPMGRAVALWLSNDREEALNSFTPAYADAPEWHNPRWVLTLYSPTVWRAVSQMAAEVERRKKTTPLRAGR